MLQVCRIECIPREAGRNNDFSRFNTNYVKIYFLIFSRILLKTIIYQTKRHVNLINYLGNDYHAKNRA